jgi:hypothetical protein
MQLKTFQSRAASFADSSASLIAVGLAFLIAGSWMPALPVVTAMAILALGATNATIARFSSSPSLVPVALLNAATYLALYGLFIGATLYAATAASTASVSAWTVLDLAASTLPMAAVLHRTMRALRQKLERAR